MDAGDLLLVGTCSEFRGDVVRVVVLGLQPDWVAKKFDLPIK